MKVDQETKKMVTLKCKTEKKRISCHPCISNTFQAMRSKF